MFKRIFSLPMERFCYLIFLGTFLYAIGFIGNFGVPRTLDGRGDRTARHQSCD